MLDLRFSKPHSDSILSLKCEYSETYQWSRSGEQRSERMVLRLRSHCCHFRWRLRLTGPVTENRSLNQLTHGGEGGLGRNPTGDQRLNQQRRPTSAGNTNTLSVFTNTHEDSPETTRLDDFIGCLPKDKNRQSMQVWTSVIVTKLEQQNYQSKQPRSVHT